MKKLLTILFLLFSFTSYSQKQDSIVTFKGVVIETITDEDFKKQINNES